MTKRDEYTPLGWLSEPITLGITFNEVDPDVLGLLTGGVMDPMVHGQGTFAVEVWTPIKRTFWKWLRRKPVQYNYILVPHAQFDHPHNGYSFTRGESESDRRARVLSEESEDEQ